jgi:hypothetical protein
LAVEKITIKIEVNTMGEEFYLVVVSMTRKPNENKKGEDLISPNIQKLLEVLKDMTFEKSDMRKYYEESTGDFDEQEVNIEGMKEEFEGIIIEFNKCLDRRDIAILWFPERAVIMSGGMSYGDDPTDSYSTIERFSYLPEKLLSVGGFEVIN